jgi:type II secretory pathway component PulF
MPSFKYKAKEGPEKIVTGTIPAADKDAAIKKIEEMGYFPVKVEEIAQKTGPVFSGKTRKKVKTNELILFSRQLAILIKSGIPILKCLEVISDQAQSPYFRTIVAQIHNDLKEGSKLSESLAKYPHIFSSFYVAMIQAAEDSGNLETVLIRLAEYRKSQAEIVSMIRLALIYPSIMGVVGAGTIIFMLTFVMPRLMRIFHDLGENLPLPTKILLGMSNHLTQWGAPFLIGLILVVFLIRYELKRKSGQRLRSMIELRIPVLGQLILKKELALLSRTLELLIKSGISVLKAIELTAPVLSNEILRQDLLQGYKELTQGSSLGKTLKQFKVFPVFMTNLISVGEESGRLDLSLGEIAGAYEKDTQESVKAFTAILEPAMILGMGLIVGFIVIAMLLPIFQINLAIK